MPKNILIFSDGTGQMGGQRPDQRLSNVYKMYRAMRPGPDSPIKPNEQYAFYDPGLGAGEVDGVTFKKTRNMLEAAVGTGIDENVIDCYEAIISSYEVGDRICIFGFSRGAYTARAVTNVLNLCGVPTQMPDGTPVPRFGPKLRKIATDAVKYVYNHGAGSKRSDYEEEREEKARRFRTKYGSNAEGDKANEQGNVQPTFVGVFDTVAALGNRKANVLVWGTSFLLLALLLVSFVSGWHWAISAFLSAVTMVTFYWLATTVQEQFKYFSPDPENPLRFGNPSDWPSIWRNGHWAVWNQKHYDRYLDSDVQYARHALAIDEQRADFPRVKWGSSKEAAKTEGRKFEWMKQYWFAGCHSDIGGSYPEPESRLSDIALKWMIDELAQCVPEVQIRKDRLVTSPDPMSLQHEEKYMFSMGRIRKEWRRKTREVKVGTLHETVLQRMKADAVPQMDKVKQYRPDALAGHPDAVKHYESVQATPTK
jgi:uncharacterized protein (DUF2235 family)